MSVFECERLQYIFWYVSDLYGSQTLHKLRVIKNKNDRLNVWLTRNARIASFSTCKWLWGIWKCYFRFASSVSSSISNAGRYTVNNSTWTSVTKLFTHGPLGRNGAGTDTFRSKSAIGFAVRPTALENNVSVETTIVVSLKKLVVISLKRNDWHNRYNQKIGKYTTFS